MQALQDTSHKHGLKTTFVFGFLSLASVALVSTAGVANAMSPGGSAQSNPPASKEDCKQNGWMHRTDEHGMPFKNQGQCIKWVEAHNHGYGGGGHNTGNNVSTNVNVSVNGNNNIVNIIIKFIFG